MSRKRIVLALGATAWVVAALLSSRLRSLVRRDVLRRRATSGARPAPERELWPEEAEPAEPFDLRAPDPELLSTIDDEWASDIPDLRPSR